MQISIVKKYELPDIPSASGVEVADNMIYIVGDDSSWLYVLDSQAQLKNKLPLFPSPDLVDGRIPKANKPDFEGLTMLLINNTQKLLTIGSGSKSPERDQGYLLDLASGKIEPIMLTGVYNQLRQIPEVMGSGKLNIEGIAATAEELIFIQRGNITGNNVLISYPAYDLYQYLTKQSGLLPAPAIQSYVLPALSGLQSGFSGITSIPGTSTLFFTASVEATANEMDDGDILGSYIGLIDMHTKTLDYQLVTHQGVSYLGKIESIAVQNQDDSGHMHMVAVTDSDQGGSELLFLEVQL